MPQSLPLCFVNLNPSVAAAFERSAKSRFLEVICHQPRRSYGSVRVMTGILGHCEIEQLPYGKRAWIDRASFDILVAHNLRFTVLRETDEPGA